METDSISVLTVGFSTLSPYCFPSYNAHGNITGLLGNHGEIINFILQFYKWSARYIKSDEEGFGLRSENGSWSSVMGLLTRNEIDISPPFHMSPERSSATKFSFPVLFEEVTFATRAPGYVSKVFVIVKPFSQTVWAICVFTMVYFAIFMWRMSTFIKRKHNGNIKSPFQKIIDYIVTPGVYSEKVLKSTRMSWRIAIFSWSLFILIISVTYSGILTSMMTSPLEGEPIDKLETLIELINENKYYSGSLPGLVMNYLIQVAAISKNLKLKHPAHSRSPAKDRKDATLRMLNERYAFVWLRFWFTDIFLEMGENTLNKFHVASDTLMSMLLAMGLSENSKLKDKIDRVVLIQLETGLIPKWTEDILIRSRVEGLRRKDDKDLVEKNENSIFAPLSLYQCSSAFFILGLGYATSFLVLMKEIRFFKFCILKHS